MCGGIGHPWTTDRQDKRHVVVVVVTRVVTFVLGLAHALLAPPSTSTVLESSFYAHVGISPVTETVV